MNQLLTKVLQIIAEGTTIFNPTDKPNQTLVGGGYYALKNNTSAGGIHYTKLVKTDKSKLYSHLFGTPKLKPSIGLRSDRPYTRRARRNVPVLA